MYAIIDIETTGGSPKTEKITEIAIFVHDGEKVTKEYSTLINPERQIPYYITQLTGISNEMVEDAPKFYEVAKDIVEITEGNIFVAHNVNFDYNFVKEEFRTLGYQYRREQLCTVKLSKKLLPGHNSYSLGKLCNDMNIEINGRHRAAGDALATVKLFEILLKKNQEKEDRLPGKINFKGTHNKLKRELIQTAPEETGIYYFYDENGEIIYIGKSKNIYKRVITHFGNTKTDRAIEMKGRIADISYEITGSELAALLLESHEIKRIKPVFNRAQRRTGAQYGLYSEYNQQGYLELRIKKTIDSEESPHTTYTNLKGAREQLFNAVEEFKLCQKLTGLYESAGACFHYGLKECNGACIGEEESIVYNSRVENYLRKFEFEYNNFFVIEKGKSDQELAVTKIMCGKYIGFGYLDIENERDIDLMHDCIKPYPTNRDTQQIIKTYLKTKSKYRIIHF